MRVRPVFFALVAAIGFSGFMACDSLARATPGSPDSGVELSGMVWEKHGDWHLNGSPAELRLGEAMPPGGLLTAGPEGLTHSLTVLLPDGQRMLCECFDAKSCVQGFRIPAITPHPSSALWDTFVQVRNVLLLRPASSETPFPLLTGRAAMAGNIEMVAPIGPPGEVSIAPALRILPPGKYSLNLANDGLQATTSTRPASQPLDWTGGKKDAPVRIGEPGLYRIRVLDQSLVPRLEIEVLATTTASFAAEATGLKETRQTILGWNQTHGGWSLHDFLRVYLQAREKAILAAPS